MSAHKFPEFSESSFFSIWSPEGRVVVNEVLNNPDLIDVKNFAAWQQDFGIDPEITKHDEKGFAIVNATMREIDKGVMSDMRAPLGDSMPMEQGNAKAYTVPIAHFTTRHFHETKATMYDKKVRFEQLRERYGEYDAQLLAGYAEKVQSFIDGMNMTLRTAYDQRLHLLRQGRWHPRWHPQGRHPRRQLPWRLHVQALWQFRGSDHLG